MGELGPTDFARLGDLIAAHRDEIVERLAAFEWAADERHPGALVRGKERVTPRAALFVDAIVSGLRGDWTPFDTTIGERTVELLATGVVTPDQLNQRALALTSQLIPFILSAPDAETPIRALFGTMQALSGRIVGEHNRRLVDELRRVDDVKTMFLRVTTHELRAPLTALRGYASMLRSGDLGDLPPAAATAVEAMARSAQASLNLVDRLVEAARLEGGAEALTRGRHRLAEVVTAAVEPLREAARLKGIELVLDVADGSVDGDLDFLAIAVRNLLGNALKYGTGGKIWIRARMAGEQAVFEVEDRGPGIPVEEQALIFHRYYRSRRTQESGVEGTGLGLYIVNRIAELHGGTATVESEPEAGSTFRFSVPVRRPG